MWWVSAPLSSDLTGRYSLGSALPGFVSSPLFMYHTHTHTHRVSVSFSVSVSGSVPTTVSVTVSVSVTVTVFVCSGHTKWRSFLIWAFNQDKYFQRICLLHFLSHSCVCVCVCGRNPWIDGVFEVVCNGVWRHLSFLCVSIRVCQTPCLRRCQLSIACRRAGFLLTSVSLSPLSI